MLTLDKLSEITGFISKDRNYSYNFFNLFRNLNIRLFLNKKFSLSKYNFNYANRHIFFDIQQEVYDDKSILSYKEFIKEINSYNIPYKDKDYQKFIINLNNKYNYHNKYDNYNSLKNNKDVIDNLLTKYFNNHKLKNYFLNDELMILIILNNFFRYSDNNKELKKWEDFLYKFHKQKMPISLFFFNKNEYIYSSSNKSDSSIDILSESFHFYIIQYNKSMSNYNFTIIKEERRTQIINCLVEFIQAINKDKKISDDMKLRLMTNANQMINNLNLQCNSTEHAHMFLISNNLEYNLNLNLSKIK